MRELAVNAVPGETRTGVFEAGHLVEIHLARADASPFQPGDVTPARIVSRHAGFAILSINDVQAIVRPAPAEPEGADIEVCITRLSLPEPGRHKLMEVRRVREGDWPGRNREPAPVPLPATASQAEALQAGIDLALAGQCAFAGGSLTFERTRAGLVFDIDGVGDPLAVNIAAVREIARLLQLFQIGGSVLVDFVAMPTRADRLAVVQAFDAASAADPRAFERTAINGYGLLQIIRARPGPSLLDLLLGTNSRSPCTATLAVEGLRACAAARGAGPRTLTTTPAIAQLLATESWRAACHQLERSMGAAISVVTDSQISSYGHVHVIPV